MNNDVFERRIEKVKYCRGVLHREELENEITSTKEKLFLTNNPTEYLKLILELHELEFELEQTCSRIKKYK